MSAIRLARGFTGRHRVVKFAGCYHGHVDALLAAAGSGVVTLRPAGHPGRHRRADRRDDRAALQRPRRGRGVLRRVRRRDRLPDHRGRRRQHGRDRAAARVSTPGCARSPRAHGALLIMDEVMTGFRVSAGRLVRPRPGRRGPVHLRQGDERRPARRGVRRPGRRDGRARAGRAGLPGRARCRGTRSRSRPGWPRCATPAADVYAALDANARAIGELAGAALDRGGGRAPGAVRRQPRLGVLRRRSRSPTSPARRRPRPSATGRSSTRCSTPACTCRRARSRHGSSTRRWTRPRSTGSPRRCRRPRRAAASCTPDRMTRHEACS